MYFPDYALTALKMLEQSFHEAYFVGGCVRDFLMRKPFFDVDITTDMLPDNILKVFQGYKTLDIGKKHGTITVFIEPHTPVEITTYRKDGIYSDNRHPENVSFSPSIKEDLQRRDFTINAICSKGKYCDIDLYNGYDDIKSKIIRAIGNPKERFNEDALRILRALRFMSQLYFSIEKNTLDAICECKDLLYNISQERISAEMIKLLLGDNVLNTISLMQEKKILNELLLAADMSRQRAAAAAPAILEIRCALLLSPLGIDKIILDNKTKQRIAMLLSYENKPLPQDKTELKRTLNHICFEDFMLILSYRACFGEDVLWQKKAACSIIAENECYSLKTMAVNGQDLIEQNLEQGKKIGEILNILLELVIKEKLPNDKKALLEQAYLISAQGGIKCDDK